MKESKKSAIFEFLGLILGCIAMSVGINAFLKPHTIAPGGLSGLAVVLNKLSGIPVSAIMLIIGVPLVLFTFKIMGVKDSMKTLFGTVLFSVMVQLTDGLSHMNLTHDPLLSAIAGAVLLGLSLGIMFKVDASTGGTDLIALILSKKFPNLRPTQFMSCLDGTIVISAGIVNRSIETALYSGLALFIILKIANMVMDGFESSKAFFIITEKEDELRDAITKELDRGLTIINSRGGYTDERKDLFLVVLNNKREETSLKKLVKHIDPKAFLIVTDVHEVLGNGFKEI